MSNSPENTSQHPTKQLPMEQEKIRVRLTGVPETLLWPLYHRSLGAVGSNPQLQDPLAVSTVARIAYPFVSNFGAMDERFILRALRFDEQLKEFIALHPRGTIVALGDGLETQFWRVDNGSIRWLSVDLPESIEMRRKILPENDRLKNLACSALDFRWMDQVDPTHGVFVSAQGLFMYFEPEVVRNLIARCAERFPGATLMFDTVPKWVSALTKRGALKTRAFRIPPMAWGVNVNELQGIRQWHSNIVDVQEVGMGPGRGFLFRYLAGLLNRIPILGKMRPALVRVRLGGGSSSRLTH